MADPVTIMAGVGMAASAAGAGVSFLGQKEAAGAQENMYAYKAAVAQRNQQIAQSNATRAIQTGGVQAQLSGLKAAQQLGLITAEQAASGIAITGGSATAVRQGVLTGAQTQQAMVRNEAAQRAYGFQVEGVSQEEQAQMDIMSGKSVAAALPYQEAGTLLSGAGSVADKWMTYSRQGVPGFGGGTGGGGFNIFGSAKPFTGV
jgi:hypothetical protein